MRKIHWRPSASDARVALQDQVDYWERRISMGDPLFDQYLVDSYDAAKEALRQMDLIEKAGCFRTKDGVSRRWWQ